jgi:arylsulfatase A-like enzyme
MIVFTSDNGCSPAAKVKELEAQGHFPSAGLRGYKSDIWEGGHRVPFIVRWPGITQAGGRCEQTICLGDLMATCAEMLSVKLPDDAGEDSVSFLSALRDPGAPKPIREAIVHHSMDGCFAIRQGNWKLALCAGSGGWSTPREPEAAKRNLPTAQLYDLGADPAEANNVAAAHADVVERLTALLERYVAEGRSTPGPRQANDVAVEIRKKPRAAAGAE